VVIPDGPQKRIASYDINRSKIKKEFDRGSANRALRYHVAMPDFRTTRWSLIAAARDPAEPESRQALAELCNLYWYPLYAFIRRNGHDADASQDLTQQFFTQLLDKHGIVGADRAKGRFRSYLLGACRHFLANEFDRATAAKRGGGQLVLSLDFPDAERRYGAEPADNRTPEQLFERRWALTLLDRTLAELQAEYAATGNGPLFERLKESLTGDGPAYALVAAELAMTEGAVKIAAHRLRQRYRERLRETIADTVDSPDEVEDEIRSLFAALG
jgi:RNA polymerase sigma-70 factor (ECF subfamily)